MHFQAYFKHTITDTGFRNTAVNGLVTGYQLEIRFPGYRGSHLSCITRLDLSVDGKKVDPQDAGFRGPIQSHSRRQGPDTVSGDSL